MADRGPWHDGGRRLPADILLHIVLLSVLNERFTQEKSPLLRSTSAPDESWVNHPEPQPTDVRVLLAPACGVCRYWRDAVKTSDAVWRLALDSLFHVGDDMPPPATGGGAPFWTGLLALREGEKVRYRGTEAGVVVRCDLHGAEPCSYTVRLADGRERDTIAAHVQPLRPCARLFAALAHALPAAGERGPAGGRDAPPELLFGEAVLPGDAFYVRRSPPELAAFERALVATRERLQGDLRRALCAGAGAGPAGGDPASASSRRRRVGAALFGLRLNWAEAQDVKRLREAAAYAEEREARDTRRRRAAANSERSSSPPQRPPPAADGTLAASEAGAAALDARVVTLVTDMRDAFECGFNRPTRLPAWQAELGLFLADARRLTADLDGLASSGAPGAGDSGAGALRTRRKAVQDRLLAHDARLAELAAFCAHLRTAFARLLVL